jgi:hypothetical protein
VIGSWIYEGYGSAPSRGLGSAEGVELVTGLAVRDACANLAAHLPEQELVRNLLTPAASTPAPTSVPAPASGALPPAEAKPSTEEAPSTDTNPSTEPQAGTEAKPSDEPASTPTQPAPETTPKPIAVEVQPTTGN